MAATPIQLEFPWLLYILNPNNRAHRMAKARAAADVKIATRLTVLNALAGREWPLEGDLKLTVVYHPPDNHRDRDLDNLYAAFKPYQDGVCEALGVNDARIREVVLILAEKKEGGTVDVTLEERAAA